MTKALCLTFGCGWVFFKKHKIFLGIFLSGYFLECCYLPHKSICAINDSAHTTRFHLHAHIQSCLRRFFFQHTKVFSVLVTFALMWYFLVFLFKKVFRVSVFFVWLGGFPGRLDHLIFSYSFHRQRANRPTRHTIWVRVLVGWENAPELGSKTPE